MHMYYSDNLPFFDYDGTELGTLDLRSGREVLVNGEVEAFDIGRFSFFTVLRNEGCLIHVVPKDSCFGIPWKSKALIRAALRCLGVPFTVANSEDLLDALRKSRPNDMWVSARCQSNGWYAQSTVISALPKPTKEDEKLLEDVTETVATPARQPTPDTAEIMETAVPHAQPPAQETGDGPVQDRTQDMAHQPGEEFLSRREDGTVALERESGRYVFKPGNIPDNIHNRTCTNLLQYYLHTLLDPDQAESLPEREAGQRIVIGKLRDAFNEYFIWDAAQPELRAVMVAYAAEVHSVEGRVRGYEPLTPFTEREARFINNLREFVRISEENQTYETT